VINHLKKRFKGKKLPKTKATIFKSQKVKSRKNKKNKIEDDNVVCQYLENKKIWLN